MTTIAVAGTSASGGACRLQAAFDVLEPCFHPFDVAADHVRGDDRDGEHRPDAEQVLGKRLQPAAERGLLPGSERRHCGHLDEVGGSLEVFALQGVADRRRLVAVAGVPVARPPVQFVDLVGLLVEQPGPQHVGEQRWW